MSQSQLPPELWDKILDYVVNAEDSDLSHLFLANMLYKNGHYFKLESIEFEGTNDPSRVSISLNGRTALFVHFTNLPAALSALSHFLKKTTRMTVHKCKQNDLWLDVFDWLNKIEALQSLILTDSDIGDRVMNAVCQERIKNVLFVRCTAVTGFTTKSHCHSTSVSLIECNPVFLCRMAARCLLYGTNVRNMYMSVNRIASGSNDPVQQAPTNDRHSFIMDNVRNMEKKQFSDDECWGALSQFISRCNKSPSPTIAIHVTDEVGKQAKLIEVLAKNQMIAEDEYYTAYEQLLSTSHATVTFGRMFDMHRIFINGELCTIPVKCSPEVRKASVPSVTV